MRNAVTVDVVSNDLVDVVQINGVGVRRAGHLEPGKFVIGLHL